MVSAFFACGLNAQSQAAVAERISVQKINSFVFLKTTPGKTNGSLLLVEETGIQQNTQKYVASDHFVTGI